MFYFVLQEKMQIRNSITDITANPSLGIIIFIFASVENILSLLLYHLLSLTSFIFYCLFCSSTAFWVMMASLLPHLLLICTPVFKRNHPKNFYTHWGRRSWKRVCVIWFLESEDIKNMLSVAGRSLFFFFSFQPFKHILFALSNSCHAK